MGGPVPRLWCMGLRRRTDDPGQRSRPGGLALGAAGGDASRRRAGRHRHPRPRPGARRRSRAGLGRRCSRASRASASPRCSCSWSPASEHRAGRACWSPVRNRTPRSRRAPGGSGIDGDVDRRSRPVATSMRCSSWPAPTRPFLLAVDSIQTLRDTSGTQIPGGVSQVRTCTDALVGLAKSRRHRRRADGPRHEGRRPRRSAGARARRRRRPGVRRRCHAPGCGCWRAARTGSAPRARPPGSRWVRRGSHPIDPIGAAGLTRARARSRHRAAAGGPPGARGRGAGAGREPPRARTAPGDRSRPTPVPAGRGRPRPRRRDSPFGRAELFGASSGGVKVDDPAVRPRRRRRARLRRDGCPAAVRVRPSSARSRSRAWSVRRRPWAQRLAAARAAGCSAIFAPPGGDLRSRLIQDRGRSSRRRGDDLGDEWVGLAPPAPWTPRCATACTTAVPTCGNPFRYDLGPRSGGPSSGRNRPSDLRFWVAPQDPSRATL